MLGNSHHGNLFSIWWAIFGNTRGAPVGIIHCNHFPEWLLLLPCMCYGHSTMAHTHTQEIDAGMAHFNYKCSETWTFTMELSWQAMPISFEICWSLWLPWPSHSKEPDCHLQLLAKSMSWTPRSQSTHRWTKSSKCFPEYKPVEKSLSPSLQPVANIQLPPATKGTSETIQTTWAIFAMHFEHVYFLVVSHLSNLWQSHAIVQICLLLAIICKPYWQSHSKWDMGHFLALHGMQRQRQFYGSS